MSYNKARAEKEWLKWKEAEEKKLRELGVDEDTIQRLHTYDWEAFKKERNYHHWQIPDDPFIEQQAALEFEVDIDHVDHLIDCIENPKLFRMLSSMDRLTLQILFYKIQGYTSTEIAKEINLTKDAIDKRISRLKKKI